MWAISRCHTVPELLLPLRWRIRSSGRGWGDRQTVLWRSPLQITFSSRTVPPWPPCWYCHPTSHQQTSCKGPPKVRSLLWETPSHLCAPALPPDWQFCYGLFVATIVFSKAHWHLPVPGSARSVPDGYPAETPSPLACVFHCRRSAPHWPQPACVAETVKRRCRKWSSTINPMSSMGIDC